MYSPRYNITFMGLEKLHPFDAGKWGKVISFLKGMEGPIRPYSCFFQPTPLSRPLPVSSLTQAAVSHLHSQPSDCLPLMQAESFQFRRLSMICACLRPSLLPITVGLSPVPVRGGPVEGGLIKDGHQEGEV